MKRLFLLPFLVSTILFLLHSNAFAARPSSPTTSLSIFGIDVSYPQCGRQLPTNFAFGIIGVNGGTAATTNPCLKDQLIWAKLANGITSQPKVQLYVNTANPGEVIDQISTWPINNYDKLGNLTSNKYGNCDGTNSLACSWQYGWNRAQEADIERFKPAAISANVSYETNNYFWWLDVETMNTWQSGSTESLEKNTASLEGMASYFKSKLTTVGLYSTAYQWSEIVGNTVKSNSNLNGLINWRPGGASQKTAKQACSASPLTNGGKVVLTQYVSKNLDYNYSCIN